MSEGSAPGLSPTDGRLPFATEEEKANKFRCMRCGAIVWIPQGSDLKEPKECYKDQCGCGKSYPNTRLIPLTAFNDEGTALEIAVFECERCGAMIRETQYGPRLKKPLSCYPDQGGCGKLKRDTSFSIMYGGKKLKVRKCPVCKKEFIPKYYAERYCGDRCKHYKTLHNKCPTCGGWKARRSLWCGECYSKGHPAWGAGYIKFREETKNEDGPGDEESPTLDDGEEYPFQ